MSCGYDWPSQAGPCLPPAPMRLVHVRTPVNRARASAAVVASPRARNGPSVGRPLVVRTTENRGNGSSVSTTHHQRCGNRDLRLYGGACAPNNRSSRTAASSGCAQMTWSTAVAMVTISRIRPRGSAPVKYCCTRRRRLTAVPTYNTSPDGPRNR
ncbi:Uncharacterised protein [Mycobacteroides abscessus subsp. abscessus]|nr:Uncharacterised protein [Mycobacteroides abscessus subsp. abscessus]